MQAGLHNGHNVVSYVYRESHGVGRDGSALETASAGRADPHVDQCAGRNDLHLLSGAWKLNYEWS
jgi:hypothetical protein